MKLDMNYIATAVPVITLASVILIWAIRSIFDDRYIKKNNAPEFRFITNREFNDYKILVRQIFSSLEEKLKDLKKG